MCIRFPCGGQTAAYALLCVEKIYGESERTARRSARYLTQRGQDFDIRGFHDAVLGGGALLTLLERKIDQWIADEKKA